MSNNLAQTFYVDPQAVSNSDNIYVTSITLYVKTQPTMGKTVSGMYAPGMQVSLAKTINGVPDPTSVYLNSITRAEYAAINPSPTADVPTTFNFKTPVQLSTGATYAVLIAFDDPGYQLWEAKTGDVILGGSTAFAGVSNFQGQKFNFQNDGTWNPVSSTDICFSVNIAQFTSNTQTVVVADSGVESLSYSSITGTFIGGENVFATNGSYVSAQTISVITGNSTVTGTSTRFLSTFSSNDYIVISTSAGNFIRQVANTPASDTVLYVTEPLPVTNNNARYLKSMIANVYNINQTSNSIILSGSTANSTFYLQTGNTIVGEHSNATATIASVLPITVDQFTPELFITTPSTGYFNPSINFAFVNPSNPSSYTFYSGNDIKFNNNTLTTLPVNSFNGNAAILSRSLEVLSINNGIYQPNAAISDYRSARITLNMGMNLPSSSPIYDSPLLYGERLNLFSSAAILNNDQTNENTTQGNAVSKHITTKVSFNQGQQAENIFAYASAYIPPTTNVAVYAKVYNAKDPDSFNSKDWTLMLPNTQNNGQVSTPGNTQNYVNLSWSLPPYPPTNYTANGTVTVTSGNSTITGINTNFGNSINGVVAGDLVKIYPALFPNTNTYFIGTVLTVNSANSITLDVSTTNTSLVQSNMLVDRLSTPHTAFINPQNSNVVRYYNSSMSQYDAIDSMAFKIVLLGANASSVYPTMNSFQAIGVSA